MNRSWLIFDSDYLCHRALYTTQGLEYEGRPTGVIYGFLRDVREMREQFNPTGCLFAFDSRYSKREAIYPKYKESRKKRRDELTFEEQAIHREFQEQKKILRTSALKAAGFNNVVCQKGYEGDDVIAVMCSGDNDYTVVTSDEDMFQLLSPKVKIWNPHKKALYSEAWFNREYGISPSLWATVKAIAGCNTDDVPGVKGVGEKTAIKFLRGELGEKAVALPKIKKFIYGPEMTRNVQLVTLPLNGAKMPTLAPDTHTEKLFVEVLRSFGIKRLGDLKVRKQDGKKEQQGFGI